MDVVVNFINSEQTGIIRNYKNFFQVVLNKKKLRRNINSEMLHTHKPDQYQTLTQNFFCFEQIFYWSSTQNWHLRKNWKPYENLEVDAGAVTSLQVVFEQVLGWRVGGA